MPDHERTKEEFLAIVRAEQDRLDAAQRIGQPKSVAEVAVYSDFHGADYHYLHNSIAWVPEAKHSTTLETVRLPIGFVTDFASVPRPFWAILPPTGLYTQAAIIHDYMYWIQDERGWSRSDADSVLSFCMSDMDVGTFAHNTIILAVKSLGRRAWSNNKRAKDNGEKRILKNFPTNPMTTWAEWKQDNGNFQ